jgi:large conductance mechanosensitive channel
MHKTPNIAHLPQAKQRYRGSFAFSRAGERIILGGASARRHDPDRLNWPKKKDKTMLQEFKQFALKGNVVDLAIGVIIGAAFGKIVESMVADVIMPIIAGIFGNVDFSNLYLVLSGKVAAGIGLADAKKSAVVLAYGNFLTVTVNFMIIAFVLFLVVKAMNNMKKAAEAAPAPAEPPAQEKLLAEIRDLLKK